MKLLQDNALTRFFFRLVEQLQISYLQTILKYDYSAKNHDLNPHKTSGEPKFVKFIKKESSLIQLLNLDTFSSGEVSVSPKKILENSRKEGKFTF